MTDNPQRWTASSDVLSLFPTLVWKFELSAEARRGVDAPLLTLLKRLRPDAEQLAHGTGWQSPQTLHEDHQLPQLVSCIEDLSGSILRFLCIGSDAIEITACWANINPPGASHRCHSHPNNFLSGVYYLQTPAGADTINFHDPRVQTGIIRPPVTALTAANTDQVVVNVKAGSLLIFPAYLQHSVDANPSSQARISVSFNLMFSSFTERLSRPLW